MAQLNIKSILVGLVVVSLATLVGFSLFSSYQRSQEIAVSNQLLASFERQVVEVSPDTYKAYVGRYQLEPDFNIVITTDGRKLFAQGSNQIRVEIFPASESIYFNEHTEALIIFEPPEQGISNIFTLRQMNKIRYGKRIAAS